MKKLYYEVKNTGQGTKKMLVEVELKDKINGRFGRVDCLITPVKGYGYITVDEKKLVIK